MDCPTVRAVSSWREVVFAQFVTRLSPGTHTEHADPGQSVLATLIGSRRLRHGEWISFSAKRFAIVQRSPLSVPLREQNASRFSHARSKALMEISSLSYRDKLWRYLRHSNSVSVVRDHLKTARRSRTLEWTKNGRLRGAHYRSLIQP
jgi:hypothetical protein